MNTIFVNGRKVRVMEEIDDIKYGRVLWVYIDGVKEYIIKNTVVTDQAIIDYLDDHYGRPVRDRDIIF